MLRAKSSASCSAQFLPALGLAQGLRWPGTSQVWSCHRSENLPGLTPRSRPCRWCSSQRALLKLPTWHSALAVCPSSCHAIWQRKWSCPVDAKYPWPSTRTHSHPVGSGRKVLSAGTLDWRPESIEWSSTVPVAHGKRNEDCVGLEGYRICVKPISDFSCGTWIWRSSLCFSPNPQFDLVVVDCYHPVNMSSAQSCKVEPLYNATGMVKAIKDRTMCVLLGRRVDA